MSFYSYKNTSQDCCPGRINNGDLRGLNEKVCVLVKKVYDSCLQQVQLKDQKITVTSLCAVCSDDEAPPVITPPITFESCRSCSNTGIIRDLTIERLCDRPNFARIRAKVDIPIDILFCDARGIEGIGRGVITVNRDVLMFIPDESIVPFTLESLVSAICVSGTYSGNNVFTVTVCVTVILKIISEVELLVPSFGYCPIPPCEEFAENVCDEFFNLPIFPPSPVCTCGRPNGRCCCGGV